MLDDVENISFRDWEVRRRTGKLEEKDREVLEEDDWKGHELKPDHVTECYWLGLVFDRQPQSLSVSTGTQR
jgi:hypothetical protein